jgi:GT2 family glycosyltransferase
MTNALLSDLYTHEKNNIDEIVLVDNGGTDADVAGGLGFWKFMFQDFCNVRLLQLKENQGFLLAANLGLMEAEGGIKILISNDVRIKGKFIDDVMSTLTHSGCLVGQKLYTTSTGWNEFEEGRIFPYLEGFFLAAEYHIWEKLNYFDVDYVPCDYEDVDISTKALSLGYELVPLNLPYIEHLGAGTLGYNPERLAITERNREIFRKKWINGG